ncbi:MAG: adenine phosphoribosyltransferase [Chloroflexi bacterium]|nr:adenine phosphoribosyltransferase [Chloroflexota bacterium]
MDLKTYIRDIPDFPTPGIVFKDLTPLLGDAAAFRYVLDRLAERFAEERVARVAAIESRGFIFGAPLAARLGAGFVPVRKLGKLPAATVSQTYELEYGTATMEMHRDAFAAGERILLVDDLLATGGTAAAALRLIRGVGGEPVAVAFVVELGFLRGRERLAPEVPIFSLITF